MKHNNTVLRDYLAEHIPGATIDIEDQRGGLNVVVRRDDLEWSVLFTREFLDAVPAQELPQRLDELQLIEEMARAEDLPLVIEPSGVRLLSNN